MITTAIILAGGFGTRLKSVINDLPKPMAPVNDQPFLNYQLDYLRHYGIKNVILSVGYLSKKIKKHYGASYEGIGITYADEVEPLGTGGGIRLALMSCNSEELFVLNGDSFFDVNLNTFYQLHIKNGSQISLALRKVIEASRYGTILKNNDHRITLFKEKNGTNRAGIINGGLYILNKQIYLSHTHALTNFSIEKDFFEKHLEDLIIKGFEFDNYFIDIGIPEDYQKAQHDFKAFKYQ